MAKNSYRVRMADGCSTFQQAASPDAAGRQGIAAAELSIKGEQLTAQQRKAALTIVKIEKAG